MGILVVPPATSEDPVSSTRDPQHCMATSEVLDAFMGPPPKEDPNLIRLQEAGMRPARRVFHHKEAWLLKEADAYQLTKHLSLVKDQREGLQSNIRIPSKH